MTRVDLAAKEQRAGGFFQRPHALVGRTRQVRHTVGIGERIEACVVGATATFGPADEVWCVTGCSGFPLRDGPQGVDPALVLRIRLHERHGERRCRLDHAPPVGHRPETVGEVDEADGHRQQARSRASERRPVVPPAGAHNPRDRMGEPGKRPRVGEDDEGGDLRTEEISRLHECRPRDLRIAEFPRKHRRHEGLERRGQQGGRQPGPERVGHDPRREPEWEGEADRVPEHDRDCGEQADVWFRIHRVGQHLRCPVKRNRERRDGGEKCPEFPPPAPDPADHQQRGRQPYPLAPHQPLVDPWGGDKRGD